MRQVFVDDSHISEDWLNHAEKATNAITTRVAEAERMLSEARGDGASEEELKTLEAAVKASKKLNDQETKLYRDFHNGVLKKRFKFKCCYCGRGRVPKSGETERVDFEADHFRPQASPILKRKDVNGDTRQEKVFIDGEQHPGYYWLSLDWKNLLPSCKKCNGNKLNYFDVQGCYLVKNQHGALLTSEDLDEIEKPLLLHPVRDNPGEHLKYLSNGEITHKTERGLETIRILELKSWTSERRTSQNSFFLIFSEKVSSLKEAELEGDTLYERAVEETFDALKDEYFLPFILEALKAKYKEKGRFICQLFEERLRAWYAEDEA